MKTMHVMRLALVGLALVTGLSSCKKDGEDAKPDNGTKTGFTDKKWRPVSLTIDPAIDLDGDGKPDSDIFKWMPACQKDDIVVFQKDGKVMNDNGTNKCDASEARTEQTGTWTYNDNTKTISITETGSTASTETWKVVENTSSTLKVRYDFEEEGEMYQATMTMQAQ